MGSVYTEESIGKLNEAEFYERFGIGSVVLLDRPKECHEEEHKKGGRPNLLSVFQSLYDANHIGRYNVIKPPPAKADGVISD